MSGKTEKRIRQKIRREGSVLYDEIKKQVCSLPLRHRVKFALRIIAGKW
jgi:hypothetical protein